MSVAALTTTTLSAALNASSRVFNLASTTGINGAGSLTTEQSVIVVGSEAMLVQRVPVAGTVEVIRGFGGTKARSHASGATVYAAARSLFAFAQPGDPSYPGGMVGLTGDAGDLPDYRLPVGLQVVDPNTGYEYMLVDCQSSFVVGEWVVIDGAGAASQLAIGSKGRVGIVVETVGASDRLSWVLRRGTYASALFDSDVTTGMELGAAAGFAGPFDSTNHVKIERATCTTAPSTATSPTVGDGVGTAYIDNPWVSGVATFVS